MGGEQPNPSNGTGRGAEGRQGIHMGVVCAVVGYLRRFVGKGLSLCLACACVSVAK